MKILNYGSLNIDLTFSVSHIVRPGETLSSSALTRNAGGKGANQSAALAKAGSIVFHAGKIGKDGLFLLDKLKSYGVNTDFIRVDESVPTGQAVIQVDEKGQNSIVLFAGANYQITREEIDETLSFFSKGDYLILQNEINNLEYLFLKASEKEMKIVFNPSPISGSLFSLPLEKVSIFFVNEIEWEALSKGGSLIDKYPEAEIILTKGKEGAYYFYKEIKEKGEIIDLPVVDTTGAGDTFTGYYLSSRLKGYSVKDSLNLACKASSRAVSRRGAMEAIPLADEVF